MEPTSTRSLPLPAAGSFADKSSLASENANTPQETAQAPVEFSIYAPSQAPADQPFDIRINICVYDEDLVEEIEASGVPTFESLVLDLRKGDLLRLELEQGGIELDAPSQSIAWNGRDMTVVFVARVPPTARPRQEFFTTLKVSLYELPLGVVSFAVMCSQTMEYRGEGVKQYLTRELIRSNVGRAQLKGKGFGALRYKTVFISHVSEDTNEVSYIVDFLDYCGIEAVFAPRDFFSGARSWKDLARAHLMNTCDSMLLCWSASANRKFAEIESPVRFEMELAAKLEAKPAGDRKRFTFLTYQIGDQLIPLPAGFEQRPMNSPGLAARIAQRKR